MGNKATSYKFEGREFIRDSQLSEKGLSTVHLAHDSKSGEQFALKIVICPDENSVQEAMKVVEAYQLLMHPAVMPLAGYSIYASREQKGAHECAMLFPFFPDGTLEDAISPTNATKVQFILHEADVVFFFIDLCESVDAMHQVGYTHRNIRPSNVLLRRKTSARGELTYRPVLKNFSSVAPAVVEVKSREEAEAIRERAERTTNGYRAPELFDVKVHSTIDAKVDVWALGCTLYAMAFGHSPFEDPEHGLLLKELKAGDVQFPANHTNPVTKLPYTPALCDIMTWMLAPLPAQRPSLPQVLARLRTLPVCLAGDQDEEEPYSVSYSDVAGGGPITFFQLRGHAIPSLKRIAENEHSVFRFLQQTSGNSAPNATSAVADATQDSFSSAGDASEGNEPSMSHSRQASTQSDSQQGSKNQQGNQQEVKEGRSKQEGSIGKERSKKEQETKQSQRVETLEKGVELVKFGRKGKPHKTLFRLVDDRSTLQWVSKGAGERRIRLCEVRKMTEGHETDVFARFAKSQQYKAKRHVCFSLIFMEGSSIPTLDVMCEADEEYAIVFNGLKELIFPDQRY